MLLRGFQGSTASGIIHERMVGNQRSKSKTLTARRCCVVSSGASITVGRRPGLPVAVRTSVARMSPMLGGEVIEGHQLLPVFMQAQCRFRIFGFWQSIRTSNPIESTFGTIRHRTKRSKGCLSRDGMLHMMFKLGQCAEKTWRRLRGFDYLAKVVTGIKFRDGVEVTDVNQAAA